MNKLFIKGVEFFNFVTGLGLRGLMTPFNNSGLYPTLNVKHLPGKISVTAKDGETVTMADTDTLRIADGKISVIKGPSHYSDKWRKLFATTFLQKSAMEFSQDPVFVPYGCMAWVYDSNRSFVDREAMIYHEPGRLIHGHEIVVVFDNKDRPERFFIRGEKSVNAFNRLEKFISEHGLEQRESGAFDHVREDAQARFEARVAEDKKRSARSREFWALIRKIDVPNPIPVELGDKKFTVRGGIIYPGFKVGGKKIDRESAFDSGLLHQIADQVQQNLAAG